MTYQGNPVCVKCTEPHFNHELRAGQEQEIKVEEVFELVKQHLKKKKADKKRREDVMHVELTTRNISACSPSD